MARKNRLVFVEALFQHPNPQGFCGALHNVYCDSVDANGEVRVATRTGRGIQGEL